MSDISPVMGPGLDQDVWNMGWAPEQVAGWNKGTAEKEMESSGLAGALRARKSYEELQARRGGFESSANRGFIGGGMARGAAMPALAAASYADADRRSAAFNTELAGIVQQQQFDQQMLTQREGNELQRRANEPSGLFASLGL